jgi:molybdopterin converting factor small subunit
MIEVELGPQATVADLRGELARQVPSLAPLMRHLMIAVNTEYAEDCQLLQASDEIACIPPVSGG